MHELAEAPGYIDGRHDVLADGDAEEWREVRRANRRKYREALLVRLWSRAKDTVGGGNSSLDNLGGDADGFGVVGTECSSDSECVSRWCYDDHCQEEVSACLVPLRRPLMGR